MTDRRHASAAARFFPSFFPRSFPRFGSLLAVSLALALAGCATDPPTRFYSLLPGEPARQSAVASPSAAAPTDAAPVVVTLAAVRVPAQVDQPQWLVRLPDGSLQLLEQDRWAAPLRDEFQAALLEALTLRWGVADSRTAPVRAAAAWRVVVDVSRFESILGREARMEARWSLVAPAPGTAQLACAVSLREPADTPLALARGHQRAVVSLADAIGLQLRALARGEAGACLPSAAPS